MILKDNYIFNSADFYPEGNIRHYQTLLIVDTNTIHKIG